MSICYIEKDVVSLQAINYIAIIMRIKYILSVLLMCLSMGLVAQPTLDKAESALIYYMPYTWVDVYVEYQQMTAKVGPFVQYAERYLGTKDVVTEDAVVYTLTDIRLTTRTTADAKRAYKVPLTGKGIKASYLTLDEHGVLQAINLREPLSTPHKKGAPKVKKEHDAHTVPCMPLLEEQMMANSIAKMAEGAARQIYRIRETRLNILSGDVDHAPADGEAMKLVLQELDAQEQALTALFIGTKTTKTLHKEYALDPAATTNGVLFRFSQYAGPVAADDLSGEPYYIDVHKTIQHHTAAAEPVQSKYPTYIYYNLPGSATIDILHNEDVLVEKTMPVAQFGISVPLDQTTGLRDAQVVFDTQTGTILSIIK